MSTIPDVDLTQMRQGVAGDITITIIDWDKPTINAALQEIDNWYEENKASGSAMINAATAPFVFTNPEKKKMFKYWLLNKFGKE